MVKESIIKLNIAKALRENEQFRKEYFRTRSRNEIATQLIALRKKRRMTQKLLAVAIHTKQSAISRIEKADYASWNNHTLEGIADALGGRWRHILEDVEIVIQQYEHEEREFHSDTTGAIAAPDLHQDITEAEPTKKPPEATEPTDTRPVTTPGADYINNELRRNEEIYG